MRLFIEQVFVRCLPVLQHGVGGLPRQPVILPHGRGFPWQACRELVKIHSMFILQPADSAAVIRQFAAHCGERHIPQSLFGQHRTWRCVECHFCSFCKIILP